MVTNWINTPNSIEAKIEKRWEDMWKGRSKTVKCCTKAIRELFIAWVHGVWAWISKGLENLTNENNSELLKSRKVITESHKKELKNSLKETWKSVRRATKWWIDAVIWTTGVTVNSVRKAMKKDTDEAEPMTTNNNSNNRR